jgi:predicted ATPase/transcriptional regulator with GAF, ATPase, and Fis domain
MSTLNLLRRQSFRYTRHMVPGYTLEKEIFRARKRAVYRGIRDFDGMRVIVKTFPQEFPSAADLDLLKREFEIMSSLEISGVARAIALIPYNKSMAIIMKDTGGQPLRKWLDLGARFELEKFLEVAISLAGTLGELHQSRIIHKDVNPKNIIFNPETGTAHLIDFSISTRLPRQDQKITHPDLLEGTLPYISPEQTGRMNRSIDYRTDFYSLGVTFYEMLTGRLPFESNDPLELVHWHIAKNPVPPCDLISDIPVPVSDIVLKLLSKNAEERYSTGFYLKTDLESCLIQFRKLGSISPFTPGKEEASDRFNIPQKLYGREPELNQLHRSFDHVSNGAVELLMVSGYSGIGKTSLIHEVHKPIVSRKGYFTGGKFDQLNRVIPYSALIQALQELVRQILTESTDRIQVWRDSLLQSLGPNGRIITDVIPEVELIIGEQPPVAALGPAESQNRFHLVFLKFIDVFAQPDHPLVIFLDDLQWADSATLKLLNAFALSRELHHFLVIGAYRDNEVGPGHSLKIALSDLAKTGAQITEIMLGPLETQELNQFVSETLNSGTDVSKPLTDLLMQKTLGNPFFVTQFLRSLYQDALIFFDRGNRRWEFDLDRIQKEQITDNVVDLMAKKIQKLSYESRRVVILGACIGNRFDLQTLAIVNENTIDATRGHLWQAVQEGYIVPLGDHEFSSSDYRFLHDRVQQAAYELIPHEKRKEIHLKVGEMMLAVTENDKLEERLFDIANHMNVGSDLIISSDARLQLAQIDLMAGLKAKSSAAYEAALGYFQAGIHLLPADPWQTTHELSFQLHLESAECDYLCGNLDRAEKAFVDLLNRADTKLEKSRVYYLMILQYESVSRYLDAIRVGHDALQMFGLTFPVGRKEKHAALEKEITEIEALVGKRNISELVDLPAMRNPEICMVMKLLSNLHTSCYLSGDEPLTLLNTAAMVRLSLEHGNMDESAYGYVLYAAMLLGPKKKDYKAAYEFGLLAQQVNERYYNPAIRARVLMNFSWAISLWRAPIEASIPISREAFRLGNENGLFVEASYALFNESWFYLLTGSDLWTFRKRYQANVSYNRRVKMDRFADAQQVVLQWGYALHGLTKHPVSMSDENFNEGEFCLKYRGHSLFEMFYFVGKLAILYTFEEYRQALEVAREAERVIQDFTGTIWDELTVFYKALTLASLGEPESMGELDRLNSRLKTWAENAPYTFQIHHLIVSAEIARVRGDILAAANLFETAIQRSSNMECPRERAVSNELYAKLWIGRGQQKVARTYMTEALDAFVQWGAHAKVRSLRSNYAQYLDASSSEADMGTYLTTHARPGTLDAFSVAKAAQAISSEIVLEKLLDKLIRIILENAGAQKALLIQKNEGEYKIQAKVAMDPHVSEAGFSEAIANYVMRTSENVVLAEATRDTRFLNDPYIQTSQPRSIMCVPILHRSKLIGLFYLENNLASDAFTPDRIEIVQTLASQSAISMEIAQLYAERTRAEEELRNALAEVEDLKNKLQAENIYLQEEIKSQHNFEQIVGVSVAIKKVFQNIERVARTDSTVLVMGETGTGKELVSRAIHTLGNRSKGPLITVNCAALPTGLIESELFGHEKGAFTGAHSKKKGRFELADGGTIFLDEIGELPLETQTKLLRVLQEQEIERVGGTQRLKIDVRVIAATNKDLEQLVKAGIFRADLYYRLNIFPIIVPPLRERRDDIPLLTAYFVSTFARRMGKKIDRVSPKAQNDLITYSWPGNVRELANVLERAVILCDGGVLEQDQLMITGRQFVPSEILNLEETERQHILKALQKVQWRVGGAGGAAELLGLNRTTLLARMKKLGIQRPSQT